MLTGTCLIAKHYYEKFQKEKNNKTIVQEKYEQQVQEQINPLSLILGLVVLFIEISLAIFIFKTQFKCYQGVERLMHIALILFFPIPYIFVTLFASNDCVKNEFRKDLFKPVRRQSEFL